MFKKIINRPWTIKRLFRILISNIIGSLILYKLIKFIIGV